MPPTATVAQRVDAFNGTLPPTGGGNRRRGPLAMSAAFEESRRLAGARNTPAGEYDQDWYRVDITDAQTSCVLRADLAYDASAAVVDLEIANYDLRFIAGSFDTSGAGTQHAETHFAGPATYYIYVYVAEARNTLRCPRYTLRINTACAAQCAQVYPLNFTAMGEPGAYGDGGFLVLDGTAWTACWDFTVAGLTTPLLADNAGFVSHTRSLALARMRSHLEMHPKRGPLRFQSARAPRRRRLELPRAAAHRD